MKHLSALPAATQLAVQAHQVQVPGGVGSALSASVFSAPAGLAVMVRTRVGEETLLHVAALDGSGQLVGAKPVVWSLPRLASPKHHAQLPTPREVGDVRAFAWRGGLWALVDLPGARQQALVELGSGAAEIVEAFVQPPGSGWMPLAAGDELSMVTSVSPLVVLKVNAECVAAGKSPAPGYVQGSAQFIPWMDRWLGIVYQVYTPPADTSRYNPLLGFPPPATYGSPIHLHQFVLLDGALTTATLSAPFYVLGRGVERCAGLAAVSTDVLLSGASDGQGAWVARCSRDTVTALFK